MSLLVLLVLEHDDVETDEARGDHERGAGEADEAELPGEGDTEDDADDEGGAGLDDSVR